MDSFGSIFNKVRGTYQILAPHQQEHVHNQLLGLILSIHGLKNLLMHHTCGCLRGSTEQVPYLNYSSIQRDPS